MKKAVSPNTIIAQHDARHFPNIPSSSDESGSMHFDRILCDVPCTGDGAIRKALASPSGVAVSRSASDDVARNEEPDVLLQAATRRRS